MATVKGHYNGSIVVLDELAPVQGEAAVRVIFPDAEPSPEEEQPLRHYWDNARELYLRFAGTPSDPGATRRRVPEGRGEVRTMSAAPELLTTAADLERLSAQGPRYELIAGVLEQMSPVGGGQGNATINLSSSVTVYVRQRRLGACFGAETGFLLARNPDTVLAPDWAFIRGARAPEPLPQGWVPVVPDLVLETRSPNDSRREIQEKIELWLRFGVQVVWDLDPARRELHVHRKGEPVRTLGPQDVLTEEDLLPGFSLILSEL